MQLAKGDYLRHKQVGDYWQVEEIDGDLYTIVARGSMDLQAVQTYFDKVEVPIGISR